jgi:hypothetical protein
LLSTIIFWTAVANLVPQKWTMIWKIIYECYKGISKTRWTFVTLRVIYCYTEYQREHTENHRVKKSNFCDS